MRSTGVAVILVAALVTVIPEAMAVPQGAESLGDGGFCASTPTEVDLRIAAAVNALSVSGPETAPIAVLDTGVDGTVPELAGSIVNSFDALAGTDDAADLDGHGTEVAGIAAGSPGLMQGISPNSPIMPVRIFNRLGESSTQALVTGIRWASDHGAVAINISSAQPQSDTSATDLAALTRATSDAFNRGALVIASAGNEGTAQAEVPAALPHVLAVGAADLLGARATFSNFGPWIDVVSPAASLIAPMPAAYCATGFGVANSTSFAAPAVAGAAALLAKLRPELNVEQRFDVLRTSARDVPPAGRDDATGFGLLNVQAAISAAAPARQSSAEVDDDPFYVRGANAATHPTLLNKSRKSKLTGQVSPAKDPSDVYKVKLRKGERFVASATVKGTDALLSLALWKPAVGDFDVTNEVTKMQIVSSGGFSPTPELKMRVPKGGTYYVSVEAPDAVDPEDPEAAVPASEPYQLVLSRQKLPKKKVAKGSKRPGR